MEGARLATWELRQGGIDYKLIPDSAAAWLFERETIDAVLIDAEWIAANGDSAAVVGSRAVAQQAAAAASRARPGAAAGRRLRDQPTRSILRPSDGAAIPADLRPVRELVAYLGEVSVGRHGRARARHRRHPRGSITALVTERGVLSPPGPESVATLLAAVAGGPS